jgi:hypothetical protein
MTNSDQLVVWLREAMDAAERDAEAATPGPWSVNDESYPETVYSASNVDVVAGGRWGGEASVFESAADAVHIARHHPAAVLRRIAADRKLLDDLERVVKGDYIDDGELPLAEHVLRLLAEGYGWAEETSGQ